MHEWTVAGGIVEGPDGVLLVRNKRRWGGDDWSTPGGVIDAEDQDVVTGLTREVLEETGITVTEWEGPVYEVSAVAPDMGWHMRAHVFVARSFEGVLSVDDPDGIVVDAAFVGPDECTELLAACYQWVREPLREWLEVRWGVDDHRLYHYEIRGLHPGSVQVERVG